MPRICILNIKRDGIEKKLFDFKLFPLYFSVQINLQPNNELKQRNYASMLWKQH